MGGVGIIRLEFSSVFPIPGENQGVIDRTNSLMIETCLIILVFQHL